MTRPGTSCRLAVSLLAIATLPGCSNGSADPATGDGEPATLREAAARAGKSIGTAVRESALADASYRDTLLREFDAVTPENSMKWGPLAPTATTYEWKAADELVDFAEQHGLAITGHTLVWDQQLPPWIGPNTSPDELREALRAHITTTVGRYRGRIASWDVVNEAVDVETGSGFTESVLWEKLGPDYIRDAFVWAHEADPEALLYYNEVGIERIGPKSDSSYELIRGLVADGVPIHGVGFQSHLSTHRYPAESDLRANIRRFAELGLRVRISELDARTLLQPGDRDSRLFAERLAFQQVVGSCVLEPGCESVTFWGFSDGHSWIVDEEPAEEPLLFERSYARKPAYQGALDGLAGRVPARGANVIANGDFSAGTEGWGVSSGELVLEPDSEPAGACHAGRTDALSALRREPLLEALSAGGPYALSALVRLRGGGPAPIQANLVVTSAGATPTEWNLGTVVADDAGWVELAGYFSLGFAAPPDAIELDFSGAPAGVDVCLARLEIQPLAP